MSTFSQLQILKCHGRYRDAEKLFKLLEISGKNIREFYAEYREDLSLNLVIAKFCKYNSS